MQVKPANLRGRQIDVVGAGQVRGFGGPQEAKTIGQDLKNTVTKNLLACFGLLFKDGKHKFLLAKPAGIFNFKRDRQLDELGDRHSLEFREVHS